MKEKKLRITISIVGFIFFVASVLQIITSNKKDERIDILLTNINNSRVKDSTTLSNINASLSKFNLKISGDSVNWINNTFVTNNFTDVKSENQKGGQVAGTINNINK